MYRAINMATTKKKKAAKPIATMVAANWYCVLLCPCPGMLVAGFLPLVTGFFMVRQFFVVG